MKRFLFDALCFLSLGSAFSVLSAAEPGRPDHVLPIHCTVVNPEGQPVDGAEVIVYRPPSRIHIPDQTIIATGRTDKEGLFRSSVRLPGHLEFFHAEALAFAPGYVGGGRISARLGEADPPQAVKITLGETGDFHARILQPDGDPAAGLECWVNAYGMPRDVKSRFPNFGSPVRLPGDTWKATTDSDGRLTITGAPKDASIYLAHRDARYAQFSGKHNFLMPKSPKAGAEVNMLQLTRPGSLRGRVVLPDKSPASGAIVSIIEHTPYNTSYGSEMKVAADGTFFMEQIPASTYKLHYDTQPPLYDQWIGAEREGIKIMPGEVTDLGDISVSEVSIVTMEVLDAATGREIESPLQFRVPSGKQEVNYRTRRYAPKGYEPPDANSRISVTLSPRENKTIQIKLRAAPEEKFFTGSVVDTVGKPVTNAIVLPMVEGSFEGMYPGLEVDKEGRFRAPYPRKAYRVALLAWNEKAMSDPLDVKPGDDVKITIRESGFGRVQGQICDDDGKPIKGAKVHWNITGIEYGMSGGPVPEEFLTDADGRFEIPRLWGGGDHLIFFCSAEGYGRAALRDEKLANGETKHLKITLRKTDQSLSGIVVDSKGNPVDGAQVDISDDEQPSVDAVRTNADGRFYINGLCIGDVYVTAELDSAAAHCEIGKWAKVPAQDVRLVLPDADGEVKGIVVDTDGRPVANARLIAYRVDRKGTTDQNGGFHLKGLMEGWFSMDVRGTSASGATIEHRARLKTGMTDTRILVPAEIKERKAQPVNPVNLIGKSAAEVQVATWINSDPLPAKMGGKVRILDFWGLECGPCISGFPKVQKFWDQNRGKDLEIVALSSSFYPADEVREFLAKHPGYNFCFAIQSQDSTAYYDYDIRGIPRYVVVDRMGKIVTSGWDWAEASAAAEKLLK